MSSQILLSGPASIGEIADHAIRLVRRHFAELITTVAVVMVPIVVVDLLLLLFFSRDYATTGFNSNSAGEFVQFMLTAVQGDSGSGVFPMPIIQNVANTVVTLALLAQCLGLIRGQVLSSRQALRRGLGRFWSYIWYGILAGLCLVPAVLAIFLFPIIGAILMLLLAVWLQARWIAASAYIVDEELGGYAAMGTSWNLTAGHQWRSILFKLIWGGLTVIVSVVPVTVVNAALAAIMPSTATPWAAGAAMGVQNLVAILWAPFSAAATVLYYFDLRVRTEGFDLAQRVTQLEQEVHDESMARSG